MLFHAMDEEQARAELGADYPLSFHPLKDESGRNFSYVDTGQADKPPLVFIHGSPGSWDNFLGFFKDNEIQETFRIISVDRPGFGFSDMGKAEPSLEEQSRIIGHIFTRIPEGQQIILVGHSLGGPVIAQMALDYPERIKGLVFVAGSMDPELEKTKWFQIPAQWIPIKWLIPKSWRASNEEILPLKAELERLIPHYPRIRVPSIILQGELDELVPPGNADFLEKQLINAEVQKQMYPQLNHFIPWSRPRIIKDAIFEMHEIDGIEEGS